MSIPLTGTAGFWTRLGLLAGGLNEVNTFRGTTVGATRVNNIRAQFNTTDQFIVDQLYQQGGASYGAVTSPGGSYQGTHGGWLTYLQQLAGNTLIQMAADSAPTTLGTLAEAIDILTDQMEGSSDSIQKNTVSVAVSTGTNTGDGVCASSTTAADGNGLENAFAETLSVVVTSDSFSGGATAGSEPYSVVGVIGPTDTLNWNYGVANFGSNCSTSGTAVDATLSNVSTGNLLSNSGFETFGTGASANTPTQWIIPASSGVDGTDILKDTGTPYSGTADMKFLGDGATLSGIQQQFNNAAGNTSVVLPRQVLCWCIRVKIGSSAPAAGKLRVSLVDGSGNVINNDAAVANQTDIDLTVATTSYVAYSGFFQLPTTLPAAINFRLKLSTAITAAKFVQFDHCACCAPSQMYNTTGSGTPAASLPATANTNIAGGPYLAVFSGATKFVKNDTFSAVVSNNYTGKLQMALWRLYNMPSLGLRVPTSGAPTVSDALVT